MITEKKKNGSLGANKTTAKRVNHDVRLHKYYTTIKNVLQVFLAFFTIIILLIFTVNVLSSIYSVPELKPITHKVHYGETVWSIAKEYKPDDMTMDEYMGWVYEHNDCTGDIYPGDVVIMGVER